jgi:hypothetical protein
LFKTLKTTKMKSENITNLITAVIAVMNEVEGVEKNMTIGTGAGSYKGVSDQEVKKIVGSAMARNGLAILPIGIKEKTQLSEWDETGQYGTKRKQSIFTKVKATYLLSHISGEWCKIKGIGHGIDSQDKSAGKATTYALKYAMLYTFLVPTGKIDDADTEHSDNIPVPPATAKTPVPKAENKGKTEEAKLLEDKMLVDAIIALESAFTIDAIKTVWDNNVLIQGSKTFQKAVNEAKAKVTPKEVPLTDLK